MNFDISNRIPPHSTNGVDGRKSALGMPSSPPSPPSSGNGNNFPPGMQKPSPFPQYQGTGNFSQSGMQQTPQLFPGNVYGNNYYPQAVPQPPQNLHPNCNPGHSNTYSGATYTNDQKSDKCKIIWFVFLLCVLIFLFVMTWDLNILFRWWFWVN